MRNLLIWGGERQKITAAVYPGAIWRVGAAGRLRRPVLPAAGRGAAGRGAAGRAGHPADPPAVAGGDARRSREPCPAPPRQQVAPAGRASPGSCAARRRSVCARVSPSSAGAGLRSSRAFTPRGGESCGRQLPGQGLVLRLSSPSRPPALPPGAGVRLRHI